MSFEFLAGIDHALYPRKALADARQAYRDYCSLKIVPLGSSKARIVITVNDAYENESRQVILDFLNYLLDTSIQTLLEEEPD